MRLEEVEKVNRLGGKIAPTNTLMRLSGKLLIRLQPTKATFKDYIFALKLSNNSYYDRNIT